MAQHDWQGTCRPQGICWRRKKSLKYLRSTDGKITRRDDCFLCVLRTDTPANMIQSTVYILVFVVSISKSAPNSGLNSIPSLGEVISTSKNSENDHARADVEPAEEVSDVPPHQFGGISESNLDVRKPAEVSQSQAAEEADGMMKYVFGGLGNILCCFLQCKTDEKEDESSDQYMITDNFQENFDPRKAWPHCKDVISYIKDQGLISTCSIVSATSALSDRLCIASKGTYKVHLSSEDVMRCCNECRAVGGYFMPETLQFLEKKGTVSGGEYKSGKGCIPYTFPPDKNDKDFYTRGDEIAECDHKCSNDKYWTPYENDKYYITGYRQYELPKDTAAIKAELMEKGSCVAGVREYTDLHSHYKGGIYTITRGTYYDKHAIRLIGWGKENGIEYWLVANSRGNDWGEDGIGKLKKGCCGLGEDASVWCVDPKVPT